MLQICQNIKLARTSKGLSQQEMADKIGYERGTYKNWEQNIEPSLSVIKKISAALGVPAHTLLEGVIDFNEKTSEPDVSIDFTLNKSQVLKIMASLDVLDSVFAPAVRSGKGKIQVAEKLTMEPAGKRKGPQSGKK